MDTAQNYYENANTNPVVTNCWDETGGNLNQKSQLPSYQHLARALSVICRTGRGSDDTFSLPSEKESDHTLNASDSVFDEHIPVLLLGTPPGRANTCATYNQSMSCDCSPHSFQLASYIWDSSSYCLGPSSSSLPDVPRPAFLILTWHK